MSASNFTTSPMAANLAVSDICGLWEVIRISDYDNRVSYPWLKGRYKYNFLEEMIFLCLKDGQTFHGTWELSKKIFGGEKQFSIILNKEFDFIILDISEDEVLLTDRMNKYLLVRKL